jgi:hypothetical protein
MSSSDEFPVPPDFDHGDQIARLTELFVLRGQASRIARGQRPAERAVFRKLHGVARARFEPLPGLDPALAAGIFGQGDLAAWVRFSSDTSPMSADADSTLGVGIKLFGVSGSGLVIESDTADLILQNYPVFFVDDLHEMVDFTYAGVVQGDYPGYLAAHPRTAEILDAMAKTEGSVLTTTYWGILPFHLGGEIVKYRLTPDTPAMNIPDDANDYLAVDLAQRLAADEASFTFSVQVRIDPDTMPLDQATVEWPEEQSPFVPVARLRLPRQDVTIRGQADYGQNLSFNIWRTPAENRPSEASSIAAARKEVYAAGADLRHGANGEPLPDSSMPRGPRPAPPRDETIVEAVIYPSIGVARVGNSEDEYFVGPEVTHPVPMPPGSYRDKDGKLKRQAARFRIYGVNALGEVVRELTGDTEDEVDITWQVELANTKAAWYTFQIALDIPEAATAPPSTLRNTNIADRTRLAITPRARALHGAQAGPERFDDGAFMGKPVYLGEMHTDEAARLVVLGGRGAAASYDGSRAVTFANNEGWHDDTSDGPVSARVILNGVPLEVTPAWVVVAPPNYAPQRKSVRTMWDLMRDVAITSGQLAGPPRPSFTDDILPLFERMAGLQWVNAGFAAGFGHDGAVDLVSPEALSRLSSPSPAYRELRRVVANNFREFDVDGGSPQPWPWLYGDATVIPPVPTPRQHAALSPTQLTYLRQWTEGDFDADYDPDRRRPETIDEVPVSDQGAMLTRAALEFCLADAFHPGCEMTWPVRTATMYSAPFRFAHAASTWVPPFLGAILSSDNMGGSSGPLGPQRAGDVTRWMAVPWQTDTASCRSGYIRDYDPYLPSFWPARVPNQVLTRENYDIVVDVDAPLEERRRAFANRAAWVEPLGTVDSLTQLNNMVTGFDHLGVVETRPGAADGEFPSEMEVEDRHWPIDPLELSDDDAANEASPQTFSALSPATPPRPHPARRRSAADIDMSDRFRTSPRPGAGS